MSNGRNGNPIYFQNILYFGQLWASRLPAPIFLSSVSGMKVGDTIEIMLNNGELFKTTITAINVPISSLAGSPSPPNLALNTNNIQVSPTLPFPASAGNIVFDITQNTVVAASRAELSTDLGG